MNGTVWTIAILILLACGGDNNDPPPIPVIKVIAI